jgi:hypothetical protein
MSELLNLRNLVQETSATLERLEREIAKAPDDWSLAITAQSLRQRQIDLEKEFAFLTNTNLLDVCDYRLIPPANGEYSVASITKTLSAFQDLVTTIFDAFKTTPKIRARVGADVVEASTLNFGYSYPGSLGFVLTMPNERLLIGDSELDRAFVTIFEMAKAQRPEQLLAFVGRVGVAGIRRLYAWSRSHAEYGLSADIRWRRQEVERARVVVQSQELTRLTEIIDQASEEEIERLTLDGTLEGGDQQTRRFHMSFPGADDVVGQMGEAFAIAPEALVLGRCYRAELVKRTVISLSTDQQDTHWELTGFTPI